MELEIIFTSIFLIGVLILVIPEFLRSNSKLKHLLNNLFIWSLIVVPIIVISYLIFK